MCSKKVLSCVIDFKNALISTTSKNSSKEHLLDIVAKLKSVPVYLVEIIVRVIMFLIYLTMFFGLLLLVWGIIEWTTGWNEHNGKRNIVRGIILLTISGVLIGV